MTWLPVQVTPEEVHAHARHTGRPWLDLVLALSAIFISVVSLLVAFEHGHAERQLVAANSWPFLQVNASLDSRDGTRIWLVNEGVGPAKLELFQVLFDGRPVASALELLQRCCGVAAGVSRMPDDMGTYRVGGSVSRPGQQQTVLEIPHHPGGTDYNESMLRAFSSVSFRACYCSVFDECWMSSLQGLHPTPVARCPIGEASFNDRYPYR